jgi:hypothetical protein
MKTRELIGKLGPLVKKSQSDTRFGLGTCLTLRGPCQLENGAVYEGWWNIETDLREGQGKQIWSNGSIYEGTWLEGLPSGYGRLIGADGNYYEGQWV